MQRLARTVVPWAIRALGATIRTRVVDGHRFEQLRDRGSFLFVVWHGRILLPIHHHRDLGVVGMVSQSKDGDLTAAILAGLGYRSVRGSSSKGGKEAFHALREQLATGPVMGAIIPDGPRGPARQLKPGILRLAQQARVPILPLSAAAAPAHTLASWDRFLLPCPLARGVIVYGEPVTPPPACTDDELEVHRRDLERTLNALEARADAIIAGAEGLP